MAAEEDGEGEGFTAALGRSYPAACAETRDSSMAFGESTRSRRGAGPPAASKPIPPIRPI